MSRLEEFCYRNVKPAIKFGIAGLGQAGGKIADLFASIKPKDSDRSFYDAIAINSFWGDLDPLKNIVDDRKLQLEGGEGCGRKPEFCFELLKNPANQQKVTEIVSKHLSGSDMIIFAAGLGGGTGTALLPTMIRVTNYTINRNLMNEGKKPIPIGVIITIPRVIDPIIEKRNTVKVLEEIRDLLNNGHLRFCFVIDNDKAYKDFKEEKSKRHLDEDNWMDYANNSLVMSLHEFNMGISNNSDRNFGPRDFKNIFDDNPGCVTISKLSVPVTDIQKPSDIINKISDCLHGEGTTNVLANGYTLKDATHAGFMLVRPKDSSISKDLMDDIDHKLYELMPHTITRPGSLISWNLDKDNRYVIYTITKITDFPERAACGIQEELAESTSSLSETITKKKILTAHADFNDDIFTGKRQQDVLFENPFENLGNQKKTESCSVSDISSIEEVFNTPEVADWIFNK